MDVHDCEAMGERSFDFASIADRAARSATCVYRAAWRLEPGTVMTDEPGLYFIPALIDKCRAEGALQGDRRLRRPGCLPRLRRHPHRGRHPPDGERQPDARQQAHPPHGRGARSRRRQKNSRGTSAATTGRPERSAPGACRFSGGRPPREHSENSGSGRGRQPRNREKFRPERQKSAPELVYPDFFVYL